MRWPAPLIALLFATVFGAAQTAPNRFAPHGYLLTATAQTDRLSPYQPQPGDIVLYDELNRAYRVLYRLAHTKPPTHVAIVIAREDGSPALLDLLGPTVLSARVSIVDIPPRLQSYPGTIMIRRLRRPLTTAQAGALTEFARAQEGKPFAARRVAFQITPFCPRCPLLGSCFARTHLDRTRWFCSELVVAAAETACILDPHHYPANAIYPYDLAYDDGFDLSHRYEPATPWVAERFLSPSH